MITFEVPGKPQGKARARTYYDPRRGKHVSTTPGKTVLYENLIKSCYLFKAGRIEAVSIKPMAVNIIAYYDIPKSTTKKDREKITNGELLPTKKPDIDNIMKVVCDALNGIAYKDDSQIVELTATKSYTEKEPRLEVSIWGLED